MRRIAGLLIILAVLILGGYYGMGIIAERTIDQNIAVINQSNGLFADIDHYNRGWFTSEAKIKWRLHIPERVVKNPDGSSTTSPAQDYNVDMPITIYHGPFILAHYRPRFGIGYAEAIFPFPEQYKQQFDSMFRPESTKPYMKFSIFINYLNRSTAVLALPAFKLISKDGTSQFQWLGMKSKTSLSSNMNKVGGSIVIDGLVATKADTTITLGKVKSDYDLHQTTAGLYLGKADFSMPSFDVVVKGQKMFEVNEFLLSSRSDVENDLFSTDFDLSIKSVMANGKNYGPGEFKVALRNLDAQVLAKINQQSNTMQHGSEVDRQKALMALLPELPKLFSKGAEFEISKLSMTIPQGEVDGSLLVKFPKEGGSNPFEIMQKIQGNAKLKLPKDLVKQLMQQSVQQQMEKQPDVQQALIQQLQTQNQTNQANQANPAGQANTQATTTTPSVEQLASMQAERQLGLLEQTGLVTVSGTDYIIELSLSNGKLLVNGKPYDPSMMKFQ